MKFPIYRCPAALFLHLFLLPVLAWPQVLTERSSASRLGINSVSGTIFAPDRTPVGRAIFVRLSRSGSEQTTWTDDDGKFLIGGVGSGVFTVTVDAGKDFEAASQRLDIPPSNGGPQTLQVIIQLRRKAAAPSKTGVVDAKGLQPPKKAQEHYRSALDAAAKGDHQHAVDELLRAVGAHPHYFEAHSELGVQYQKLNQLEKADEHLAAALKIRPDAYEPMANRGIVLVRTKKFDEAENVLREAIKIKDESAVTHFYLGRALVGLKKLDDAVGEFRIALLMGGISMNEAHRALANIYLQRGENDMAVTALEAYLTANPSPADEKKLRDTLQQVKAMAKENRRP